MAMRRHCELAHFLRAGEHIPVQKRVGDSVFGSTVNQGGVLLVKATGVGKDSAVSQIVSLVQEAQTSRPPMQEFVDKVSAVFVPVVVALALLTLVVSLLAPPVWCL